MWLNYVSMRLAEGLLLDVSVGIALWEDVGVFLAEDVADSAARDDLQTSTTHPHSE